MGYLTWSGTSSRIVKRVADGPSVLRPLLDDDTLITGPLQLYCKINNFVAVRHRLASKTAAGLCGGVDDAVELLEQRRRLVDRALPYTPADYDPACASLHGV